MLDANRTRIFSSLRAFLKPVTTFHPPDATFINAALVAHLPPITFLSLPRTLSLNPVAANVSTCFVRCVSLVISSSMPSTSSVYSSCIVDAIFETGEKRLALSWLSLRQAP